MDKTAHSTQKIEHRGVEDDVTRMAQRIRENKKNKPNLIEEAESLEDLFQIAKAMVAQTPREKRGETSMSEWMAKVFRRAAKEKKPPEVINSDIYNLLRISSRLFLHKKQFLRLPNFCKELIRQGQINQNEAIALTQVALGPDLENKQCAFAREMAEARLLRKPFTEKQRKERLNSLGKRSPNGSKETEELTKLNETSQVLDESLASKNVASVIRLSPLPPKTFPLNQILYGPPGTGKTYATIRRAVEIVEGTAPQEQRECKAHFDALMNAGRIAFVTFHQSFAYEDFIEGIRPAPEGDGAARYELRDGLLKEIALRAFGACLEATRPREATFQDVWNALVKQAENDPEWFLPGLGSSKYKIWFTGSGDVMGDNIAGKGVYCAPRQKLEMLWDKLRDRPKSATAKEIMEVIHKGSHVYFLSAILQELKRLKPLAGAPSTDAPSREAIVTFLGGGDEYHLKITSPPRFVLIIDEINRGNISKILGELITLLEDDKRLSNDPDSNSLKVTLPYSGEMFALPSNLHVLGTMNTADKSLALVDVALRRRFDFEELAPDWSEKVCKKLTPEMRATLVELNRRITLRKDREHRIGHAYFVKVATQGEFDHVFHKRVIPLLQEYFFNDWDGLRFVLGEKGASGRFIVPLDGSQQLKVRNHWAWWFDENPGDGACFEWLKANYAEKSDGA